MDEKELIKLCLKDKDAVLTYPFKEEYDYPVLRHKSNNKWFGLIFYLDKKLYINLKSTPVDSAFLRDMYDFITPAWHMNKTHWIKVDIEKVPKDLLEDLILASFELTSPGRKKRKITDK